MPIWKLEPVDLTSHHWRASTYKGTVIVRAADEKRAREVANSAFIISARVTPAHDTPLSPWKQADLVRCSRLERREFAKDGPEAVLDPPHH